MQLTKSTRKATTTSTQAYRTSQAFPAAIVPPLGGAGASKKLPRALMRATKRATTSVTTIHRDSCSTTIPADYAAAQQPPRLRCVNKRLKEMKRTYLNGGRAWRRP